MIKTEYYFPELRPRVGLGVFLLCVGSSLLIYLGNSEHQLLHWDDIAYVSANPWVTAPSVDGFIGIFSQHRLQNWHPLTWLSYIPEYYFCADTASCYKATDAVLHGVNGFLVFLLSGMLAAIMFPRNSGHKYALVTGIVAAVLFVVHPQHVEAVTWIAERKELLSTGFFLAGIIAYLRAWNVGEIGQAKAPLYFFVLALLSKPMAITFPVILVLLDWTLLQRFVGQTSGRILEIAVREKAVYIMLVILVIAITLIAQDVSVVSQHRWADKIVIAFAGVDHYLRSLFMPWSLSPFYPVELVTRGLHGWPVFAIVGGLASIIGFFLSARRTLLFTGFFLVTLSPVIGLVSVGEHAFADRYSYLSMVGFFVGAGLLVAELASRFVKIRLLVFLGCLAVAVALALVSRDYKRVWKDDASLWTFVIEKYPALSATAHGNMGNVFFEAQDYQAAEGQYRITLQADAQVVTAYGSLFKTLILMQRQDEARAVLEQLLKANPENAWAMIAAANGYAAVSDTPRALELYLGSAAIDPTSGIGLYHAGLIYFRQANYELAYANLAQVPSGVDLYVPARIYMASIFSGQDKQRALNMLYDLKKFGSYQAQIEQAIEQIQ